MLKKYLKYELNCNGWYSWKRMIQLKENSKEFTRSGLRETKKAIFKSDLKV